MLQTMVEQLQLIIDQLPFKVGDDVFNHLFDAQKHIQEAKELIDRRLPDDKN